MKKSREGNYRKNSLHGRHHGRRSTHENLTVFILAWHVVRNLFLCDEADTTFPARGRVVKDVEDVEPSSTVVMKVFQLVA